MLFPWEADDLGAEEARIVGESADALLEFMVGQAAAAIRQGDDYSHLFDESLNIYQRALRDAARNSRALTSAITHDTRVTLAKATDNDLNRINKTLEDLPASFRSDLHQSAAATAQGIIDIVRRDNLDMNARARSTWYDVTARYISQVNTGAMGYEQAVRRATLELADKGIRTVDYKSGVSSDVDVAVRRHVMTQIKQAGARRTMALCEELGVELVEVSYTAHPRPSHRKWEGHIYRIVDTRDDYPDFWEGTGYQGLRGPYTALGDQLLGVNCKHDFSPYEDFLDPMWDDDPYDDEEKQRRYDLSQEQRSLERGVRKAKREAHLLEVAGVPNVRERAKIGNYQRQLRELVSENPDVLQREYARERLNGYRDANGKEIKQPAPLKNARMGKTKNSHIKWPEESSPIAEEKRKPLMAYARQKNIRLANTRNEGFDVHAIRDYIDMAEMVTQDFPELLGDGRKKLTLKLAYLDDDTFASTPKGLTHIVEVNVKSVRDLERLKEEYAKLADNGWFVAGTDHKSIIPHELGHIFEQLHNIDSVAIAEDILGLNGEQLFAKIRTALSRYAGETIDGSEIISEVFSAHYGNGNNWFAEEFFKRVKSLGKK